MESQVYGRIYLETLHAKSRCQPATIHDFFIHDSLLAFSAGIIVISTVAAWKSRTSY